MLFLHTVIYFFYIDHHLIIFALCLHSWFDSLTVLSNWNNTSLTGTCAASCWGWGSSSLLSEHLCICLGDKPLAALLSLLGPAPAIYQVQVQVGLRRQIEVRDWILVALLLAIPPPSQPQSALFPAQVSSSSLYLPVLFHLISFSAPMLTYQYWGGGSSMCLWPKANHHLWQQPSALNNTLCFATVIKVLPDSSSPQHKGLIGLGCSSVNESQPGQYHCGLSQSPTIPLPRHLNVTYILFFYSLRSVL